MLSDSNMASTRLEINFVRLLSRCESIASEKRGETEWRLEKYVGALEEMLVALRKSPSKPTVEVMTDYTRKVDFLKGLLEAEKLSGTEKALANQFLAPGRTPTITSERMPATKTVHMQTKARCTGEMRNELMATGLPNKGNSETDLRNRRGLALDERQSAAELDAVLQHHHNLQEKLAEDMLNLARNLKNNTLVAQNIIKQDNQYDPLHPDFPQTKMMMMIHTTWMYLEHRRILLQDQLIHFVLLDRRNADIRSVSVYQSREWL
ncbi:vesicle transport protein USE1 isoform X2 [Esox lucius]|uniref:vesicle transport protein USE1 isoform X2 n=1 Tax=Esox lucius TaxID=8010 RepID=UPI0006618C64|nr:vesicle transport protein USE1 isoform X2 [Esox lucius]